MLKSCKYCGRIHEATFICPQRQAAEDKRKAWRNNHRGKEEPADRFRNTNRWKTIRESVYHRDRGLCLCCLAELEGTDIKYNTYRLAAHHIIPLREDFEQRDSLDNLLLVCPKHHEMCEGGTIDRDIQKHLAKWSEDGYTDLAERVEQYKRSRDGAV